MLPIETNCFIEINCLAFKNMNAELFLYINNRENVTFSCKEIKKNLESFNNTKKQAQNNQKNNKYKDDSLFNNTLSLDVTDSNDNNLIYEKTLNKKSVIASEHDISILNSKLKLTESELQLGKTKPYWIPDEDCLSCMLCLGNFTIVNRRHHCRSCGRVLCNSCCQIRRLLPYMLNEKTSQKQRICDPCNKTLDRIELYENYLKKCLDKDISESSKNSSNTYKLHLKQKKSALKNRTNLNKIESNVSTKHISDIEQASNSKYNKVCAQSNCYKNIKTINTVKRSVTFQDGVNPGDDSPSIYLAKNLENNINLQTNKNSFFVKKNNYNKIFTKNYNEKIITEDMTNLVENLCNHIFCVKNTQAELISCNLIDVWLNILAGNTETIAILKKNNAETQIVLSFSTRGFNSLGIDELLIVVEWNFDKKKSNSFCDNFVDKKFLNNSNKESASNKSFLQKKALNCANKQPILNDNNLENVFYNKIELEKETENANSLLEALQAIDFIFSTCTLVNNNSSDLEEKLGIKRCANRMSFFYYLKKKKFMNIEAEGVVLHRPNGQNFGSLIIPSTPFFIGTLVKKEEVAWARSVSYRILFAIGKQTSCYPTPVINECNRKSVILFDSTNMSVLKIFNDFRFLRYKILNIPNSYASLYDSKTEIFLPKWCVEQLKTIIETNQNMIGWTLDFNAEADSHLVCVENKSTDSSDVNEIFKSQIFSVNKNNIVTGATFVIFDGALKVLHESEVKFVVNVVEDGIVVRLTNEIMQKLIRNLLEVQNFVLISSKMKLSINFIDDTFSYNNGFVGSLVSPIDQLNLAGKIQYGLLFQRAMQSLKYLSASNDWALRLATAINIDCGKFPARVESRYFEICEQLFAYLAVTIDPFINNLIAANQKTICIRVRVDEECATYKTEKWLNLEDQHYIWTLTLDEQLIPYLYGLCSWISTVGTKSIFFVELHIQIVSIKPLPFCCTSLLN